MVSKFSGKRWRLDSEVKRFLFVLATWVSMKMKGEGWCFVNIWMTFYLWSIVGISYIASLQKISSRDTYWLKVSRVSLSVRLDLFIFELYLWGGGSHLGFFHNVQNLIVHQDAIMIVEMNQDHIIHSHSCKEITVRLVFIRLGILSFIGYNQYEKDIL